MWRGRVFHSPRRARQNGRGTFRLLVGEKAGEESAAAGGKLPTAAALNGIAQEYFKQQGSGEPMAWKLAFEHGYEDGFKKAHH